MLKERRLLPKVRLAAFILGQDSRLKALEKAFLSLSPEEEGKRKAF